MLRAKTVKVKVGKGGGGIHTDGGDSGTGYTGSTDVGSGGGDGSGGGSTSGDGSAGFGSGIGIYDHANYYEPANGGQVSVSVVDYGTRLVDYTAAVNPDDPSEDGSANITEENGMSVVTVTASPNNADNGESVTVEPTQTIIVVPGGGQSYEESDNPTSQNTTPVTFKPTGTKGSQAYYNSIPTALNPKTVQIYSSGNTVSIYLIQAGAGGLGHLAMSLNGSAAIGITSTNGTAIGPGYASIGADNDPSASTALFGTMEITEAQANALQSVFATAEAVSVAGQQNYNVLTNNCAEFVVNALAQAGVGSGSEMALITADPDVDFANFMIYAAVTGQLTNSGSMSPN